MGRNARKGPLALLSTNAIKRRGSLTRQIECIAIPRGIDACMMCKFHSPGSVFSYLFIRCLFISDAQLCDILCGSAQYRIMDETVRTNLDF